MTRKRHETKSPTACASPVIANVDPTYDDCSNSTNNIVMNGKNIGNLLNAKNKTWGWFASGFKTIDKTADGKANCDGPHKQEHINVGDPWGSYQMYNRETCVCEKYG
jgi:hypothetical protein